jgi:hypothetical protein
MRSNRGSIVLRKIAGVFGACRASAGMFGSGTAARLAHPSIASTALSLALFLLIPLALVAIAAIALVAHPVALLAAGKMSPLVGLAFAGQTEVVSNKLTEKREELAAKQKFLGDLFAMAKNAAGEFDLSRRDVLEKLGAKDSTEAAEKVQAKGREVTALADECRSLNIKAIAEQNERIGGESMTPTGISHPSGERKGRTFGEMFVESKAYAEAYKKNQQGNIPGVDRHRRQDAVSDVGAGYAPQSVRSGLIVDAVTRPIQLLDLIPTRPISQAVDKYMLETTRTQNEAETTEGSARTKRTCSSSRKRPRRCGRSRARCR